MSNSKLVILTIDYPDPLLDKELPVLARNFDRVYLLPQTAYKDAAALALPDNVQLFSLFEPVAFENPWPLIAKHFTALVRAYTWTLLYSAYRRNYLRYVKSFVGHFLKEAEKIKPLEAFIKQEGLHDALFYDFWLVDSTLTLAELKRKKLVKHSVARTHGFDLYHERQFENHVSFQEYRISCLDAVFAISNHGYTYLQDKLSARLRNKIHLSYLGIKSSSTDILLTRTENFFRIVSCARLIPLKRISLLVDVLMLTSLRIQWIHFGSGAEFEAIRTKAKSLPENVSVDFRNETNNQDIMRFYAEHFVDLFVSVSESEGLPVSMMEAISYGIPILACSVNGVPEIVNEITGVRVHVDATPEEIKNLLENTLMQRNFDRNKIQSFFRQSFDVEKNVPSFTKVLKEL